METKTCKICERELPVSEFKRTKGGARQSTCRECVHAALVQTKAAKRIALSRGGDFSDPDFDGKELGDVWRLMCRAKHWLESRGCVIRLDGELREVKIRKLKIE